MVRFIVSDPKVPLIQVEVRGLSIIMIVEPGSDERNPKISVKSLLLDNILLVDENFYVFEILESF